MSAPTRIAAAAWRGRLGGARERSAIRAGCGRLRSRAGCGRLRSRACCGRLRSRARGWAISGLVLGLIGASACSEANPARDGADRFVDSYYVEIDLPRAKENAVGLARAKVERQIELLKGVERPESESKPTVYYRLLEERHGERPGFVYELTISLGGGETVKRRALVIVREEAGAWRAANFEELD